VVLAIFSDTNECHALCWVKKTKVMKCLLRFARLFNGDYGGAPSSIPIVTRAIAPAITNQDGSVASASSQLSSGD
jgi:hypothetical protein